MTRPAPIDSLDEALHGAADKLDDIDQEVADFLDKHIATLDAYRDLLRKRSEGYDGARRTERAIRTLGYAVIKADGTIVPDGDSILGDRGYSVQADEEAARLRANPPLEVPEPVEPDPVDSE